MPDAANISGIKHRLRGRIRDIGSPLNNRWQAYLTEEQTLETALEPSFWTDAADVIKGHDGKQGRWDIIELRKPDTGQYWELMVDEVGIGSLKVRVMFRDAPPAADIPEDSPLTTKWNVGARGHDVIRKADRQRIAGPFPSKQLAADWIADDTKKRQQAA